MVVPILGPIAAFSKSRTLGLTSTRIQVVIRVGQDMSISRITVDAKHLCERIVIVEGVIAAVMEVHLRQHGRVVVVWTIDRQAAAESRSNIHLAVGERGPIVCYACPRLPDCAQVVPSVVNKRDHTAERVGYRQ